jgi:hypothetical protein
MRVRNFYKISLFLITILMLQLAIPNVSAGEDAQLDGDLKVSAVPSQQGTGGIMTITVTATFFGGCCYSLFGNDVALELTLPPELELVDEISPKKINKFEAIAGGGAAPAYFTFSVKSFTPGEYVIKTKVTTSNAGNAEGRVTITVTKGCVITTPELFPQDPTTGKNTIVKVSAYSPIEGVVIENVEMYYSVIDGSISNSKPENETLYWDGGEIEGKNIECSSVDFEVDLWQGEIPKQNEESTVAYWIVAEDNFGNKTSSPLYTVEVQNYDEIHMTNNLLIWFAIIGSIIGCLVISLLWGYTHRAPVIHKTTKGMVFTGSKAIEIEAKEKRAKKYTSKMDRNRYVAFVIIFVIVLIVIILAILSDQYDLLRTNVGG